MDRSKIVKNSVLTAVIAVLNRYSQEKANESISEFDISDPDALIDEIGEAWLFRRNFGTCEYIDANATCQRDILRNEAERQATNDQCWTSLLQNIDNISVDIFDSIDISLPNGKMLSVQSVTCKQAMEENSVKFFIENNKILIRAM